MRIFASLRGHPLRSLLINLFSLIIFRRTKKTRQAINTKMANISKELMKAIQTAAQYWKK